MVTFEELHTALSGRIANLVKCYKIPLQCTYQHDDLVGEANEASYKCWLKHKEANKSDLIDICSAAIRNRFRSLVREVRSQKRDNKIFLQETGAAEYVEGCHGSLGRTHYMNTPFDFVYLDELLSHVRTSLLNLSRLHWDYTKEKIAPSEEISELITSGKFRSTTSKITTTVMMEYFNLDRVEAKTIEREIRRAVKKFYRNRQQQGSEEGALAWI